ncbi:MAG TPA: MarR family transcriptional regulator [Anaerolineales bacterium]|nr:MarR family transcriptional regulator [Anaerolineales bacterium]
MNDYITTQHLIDKFWESVPHVWRHTKSHIRLTAFEKYQMSEGQFQVLRRIRRGSTSVSSLAEVSGTGLPSVSKVVDTLVKRGLVVRSQDPSDRRKVPLALTPQGQKVMQDIFDEAETWLAARFDKLNREQRAAFMQGLDAMNLSFDDQVVPQ